jgi:hypothetical protein
MKDDSQGETFVAILLGKAALSAQTPAVQCAYGVNLMHTIQQLPAEAGGRIMAVVMARVGGDHSDDLKSDSAAFDMTDRQLLDQMESNPEAGPAIKLLDQAFPDEMTALAAKFREAARTRGVNAGIEVMQSGVAELTQAHRGEAIAAPDADIVRIAAGTAKLYRALEAEDETDCATYSVKGTPLPEPLPARSQAAAQDLGVSMIQAIADGRRSASQRADATAADFQLMIGEMKRGKAPPADIKAFAARKLEAATPHVQCDATAAMLEALGRLPPDVAARMMATILDRAKIPPAS